MLSEAHFSEADRLIVLRREIAAAEATLRALELAIEEARSEQGLLAMQEARAENERLLAQNQQMSLDAESAHAALEVAVKASQTDAQTDALTGLRNREVLWHRLAHDLALARRLGKRLAIFFLDVNDFKRVNDEFGHAVGDALLQHVARVLLATVRASDTVCRIGGDEFVILASATRPDDAPQVAAKIVRALATPCALGGHTMPVSVSIGYSVFPEDGESPGVLVHKADEAMYRVKRNLAAGR
jgi:diguanylate cyclase (GGDEF)-like protein